MFALRPTLIIDAASCALMGLGLLILPTSAAALTGLPTPLLVVAGLILLPSAAFIFWTARQITVPGPALQLIVWLNAVWVIGSVILCFLPTVKAAGIALILAQAAAVAVLTLIEAQHLRLTAAAAR